MQQLPFSIQHVPNRNISPDLLRLIGCNMRGMLMLMTSCASAEASILNHCPGLAEDHDDAQQNLHMSLFVEPCALSISKDGSIKHVMVQMQEFHLDSLAFRQCCAQLGGAKVHPEAVEGHLYGAGILCLQAA